MAINRAQSKMVDDFLRNEPASSGFLNQLDQGIASNRQGRRAAQQANRAVGAGPFQGSSPFGGNAAAMGTNTGGAGGRAIVNQGMGQVAPVGQRSSIGPASRATPTPKPPPAAVPGSSVVPAGGLNRAPSGAPGSIQGTLAQKPTAAIGPGPRQLSTSATRVATQSADDLLGVAGRATASGADDVAAAAVNQAGRTIKAPKGSTTGIIRAGSGSPLSVGQKFGINFTKAGLLRGAGVAGTGLMASSFFDGLDLGGENSVADRGGSGALLGGGLAAGGAIALGIPHVAAAAAGGALLVGGYQAIWGDKETTPQKMQGSIDDTGAIIENLGEMYGIEGTAMDDIMLQYQASTSMYLQNEDKEGLKQFMAGMGTQLPALMLQARDQMKAEDQESQRYESMMQVQAQFAPIFEQTLDRAALASQTAYQTSSNAAGYLEERQPQLAALARSTAAQTQSSAANLQAAYARQMAQAPITTGTNDQLQRQLAQQEMMNQQLASVGQF
jgi:hypothetical protein